MTLSADPRSSDEMLREVAAYLRRLPLVPETASMIRRVEAHLAVGQAQPGDAVKRDAQAAREASYCTLTGALLLSVRVEGDAVSVVVPRYSDVHREDAPNDASPSSGNLDDEDVADDSAPRGVVVSVLDFAALRFLQGGPVLRLEPAGFPSGHVELVEKVLAEKNGWGADAAPAAEAPRQGCHDGLVR